MDKTPPDYIPHPPFVWTKAEHCLDHGLTQAWLSGLCLDNGWILFGLCLVYVWTVPTLCQENVTTMSRLFLNNPWTMSWQWVNNYLTMAGLCLEKVSTMYSLFVDIASTMSEPSLDDIYIRSGKYLELPHPKPTSLNLRFGGRHYNHQPSTTLLLPDDAR